MSTNETINNTSPQALDLLVPLDRTLVALQRLGFRLTVDDEGIITASRDRSTVLGRNTATFTATLNFDGTIGNWRQQESSPPPDAQDALEVLLLEASILALRQQLGEQPPPSDAA